MAADPGNRRAVDEARHMAALFRKAGFLNAQAAPEYCIDELGPDNFYTYTVCVYVGQRDPESMLPLWKKLAAKLGLQA